jgi:hypothetical protein
VLNHGVARRDTKTLTRGKNYELVFVWLMSKTNTTIQSVILRNLTAHNWSPYTAHNYNIFYAHLMEESGPTMFSFFVVIGWRLSIDEQPLTLPLHPISTAAVFLPPLHEFFL